MVFEYAVDPSAISNWQDFRYVVDQCGVHHGRIIAEYPAKWKREVYRACKKGCKDIELKRIEEKLLTIGDRLRKTGRHYADAHDWLTNAEQTHQAEPFHAIVSYHNPRKHPQTLVAKQLSEDTPLWKVNRQLNVKRTGSEMAAAIRPLLQMSSQILFVDPHFDASEERFRNPLECFLKEIAQHGAGPVRIEYHLLAAGNLDRERFSNGCKHLITGIVPSKLSVKFVRWKDLEARQEGAGGKRMHPRFVLTDIGGVLVEWGLDEGPANDTVDMFLLEQEQFKLHWAKYDRATSPFGYVDETTITGAHK